MVEIKLKIYDINENLVHELSSFSFPILSKIDFTMDYINLIVYEQIKPESAETQLIVNSHYFIRKESAKQKVRSKPFGTCIVEKTYDLYEVDLNDFEL